MGPISALSTSIKRSLDFTGRSTRAEFWWTWSILYGVAMLLMAYRSTVVTAKEASILITIVLCVIALPTMAVGTRRLRDAAMWPWLFLVVFVFGLFAQIIYAIPVPSKEALAHLTVQFDDGAVQASDLGHYPVLRWLRDAMPYVGQPLALLCLILALLPTRKTDLTLTDPGLVNDRP
ncbi:MAG: DUF805 domain-containing protein [Pseudomonadota bacterium]